MIMNFPSYSMSNTSNYKMRPKINNVELKKFVNAGMIYDDVVKEYPISKTTYGKLLRRFGFQPDIVRIREKREQMVIDMYNSGATVDEIAKARNIAVATCKRILSDLRQVNLIK